MKKITVALDDKVRSRVRVWAAQHGMSASRMIANLLEAKMREGDPYEKARKVALKVKPAKLRRDSKKQLPKRPQLL